MHDSVNIVRQPVAADVGQASSVGQFQIRIEPPAMFVNSAESRFLRVALLYCQFLLRV